MHVCDIMTAACWSTPEADPLFLLPAVSSRAGRVNAIAAPYQGQRRCLPRKRAQKRPHCYFHACVCQPGMHDRCMYDMHSVSADLERKL